MEADFLSKDEVRGKRSIKTKTLHRFSPHSYDDMKDVKSGKRGHSRHVETEQVDIDVDDLVGIDPSFDWNRLR